MMKQCEICDESKFSLLNEYEGMTLCQDCRIKQNREEIKEIIKKNSKAILEMNKTKLEASE